MKPARRKILTALAGVAVLPLTPKALLAQPGGALLSLDEISPQATPRDWSGQNPLRYPDPDVIALDPRFRALIQFNSPIQRLHTGTLWAEGPAWNGVGKYLVWSDIPDNAQLRWLDDDNQVTTFRNPSGNSNGNTFDFQGRQLSCEHGNRRVARYEPDGTVTVIADRFEGKRLNSPNDVVVHPDGGIWFTDPIFGISGPYEGNRAESEIAPAIYRVDGQSGQIRKVTDDATMPNGLCFSPDYSFMYVADRGETRVFDVNGERLQNGRTLARLTAPGGGRSAADGIRCDALGNIWAGASPGVQVMAPNGDQIGMIRLPEVCANVCFGGDKRNRLFMTASQSLYSLYLAVQGAHIC
jgi:gluconolactonase